MASKQYRDRTRSSRDHPAARLGHLAPWSIRVLTLFWALVALTCAPSTVEPLHLSMEQRQLRADTLLAASGRPDGPGVAVLIAIDGAVVYRHAVGLADLEQGTAVTQRTNFRLASVSKQITAMALMILAEEGRLDIDDSMVQYLPELAVFGPDITLRHLLIHTAGLPEVYDRLTTEAADGWPRNGDLLPALTAMGTPRFSAGQRFEYCNVCYDLLALIIERVSGEDYGTFLDRRIFTPLDMQRSTTYQCPEPEIDVRALGYQPRRRHFVEFDADPLNCILGAGGIYSNLEDMQRWLQGLDGATLVSPQSLDEAFTSGTLENGEPVGYGFGWTLDSYRGLQRQSHTGSWVGFRNYISRFPEVGLTLIMLSNHSDFDRQPLAEDLTDLYLDLAVPSTAPQG